MRRASWPTSSFWPVTSAAARRALEALCAYCQESEDVGLLGTAACWLAEVLYEDGDYEAAEHWLEIARRARWTANDLLAQIAWRSVVGEAARASRGRPRQTRCRRRPCARAQATDALNARAAAFMARAEVLRLMERPDDANEAAAQALALYEQKGNLAAASGRGERPLSEPLALTRFCYIARTIGEPPCVPPWPADATSGNAADVAASTTMSAVTRRMSPSFSGGCLRRALSVEPLTAR